MAELHVEEHASPIKTPRQLLIVVLLAFAVPITLIVMLTQLVTSGGDRSKDNPALSEEAIAKRLKPVGEVVVDPSQPAPVDAAVTVPAQTAAAPAPGAKPAAAAKADAGKGKSVYETTCMVCHAAGVAGAPKIGDQAAWAPRIKSGLSTLHANAIKGKNAMPPKGGNLALTDADVNAAVDYMVGLLK
jgi:cytochrome c5